MLPIKVLKPGDLFMAIDPAEKVEKGQKRRRVLVEVIKQYPHHVMVKNGRGTRWCVTNAEIMQGITKGRFRQQNETN